MKSLNTLIKINSRELDELRLQLAKFEEERIRLISENKKLEEDLAREHQLSSEDPALGIMFANYRIMVRGKQEGILRSLHKLDNSIEILKEDIAAKFSEVKKFEIILANKITEEKKQAQARETRQLDEIAINNHLKENAGV